MGTFPPVDENRKKRTYCQLFLGPHHFLTKHMALMRRLTEREIEVLIDLYRNEECLWNSSSDEYRNVERQRAALHRISEKMGGIPVDLLTKKIRSLRIEFGAKMREKSRLGSIGGKQSKEWRFFNRLLFLKGSIVPRMTQCNFEDSSSFDSQLEISQGSSYKDDAFVRNGSFCDFNVTPLNSTELNAEHSADSKSDVFLSLGGTASSAVAKLSDPDPFNYPMEEVDFSRSVSRSSNHRPAAGDTPSLPRDGQNSTGEQRNGTCRSFCDMIYGELMSIPDPGQRAQLQFKLYSTVMQFKYPDMFNGTVPPETSCL